MGAEVLVLVTCTNRKTARPSAALMLRAVPGRNPAARADAWVRRLQAARNHYLPAASLYSGDHWHVARSVQQSAASDGHRVSVWVCSAGYGLIPLHAEIVPYAATFSPNHPDSVTRGVDNGGASAARRTWWETLAAWSGPASGEPRTIEDLVSGQKRSSLLVAASPHYLDAITDDLERAAGVLGPGRLAIFSAGADGHPSLGSYLIPCDARLQTALGGALSSLNARCVRYAIQNLDENGSDLTGLPSLFSRLLRKQPPRESAQRTPLSDEEVSAFIRDALAADPAVRPTPLLRRLRGTSRACEQSRFCRLYREAMGGRHG